MKTIALYVVVGFSGIIFLTADEQGDAGCDYRTFLSTCCSIDTYSIHSSVTINRICKACIGRSCIPKCPRGYYGEQCDEICTCDAAACDDVSGCVTTGKNSCDMCSTLKK
ncbi:cell death abnormality protein 1-like [Crassostrea angulata]|uniref:cell death abnormality protein 1-like n=1 Tax=Magallana angulata TaxID=2784310 RepID=UPI0022B1049F|nr:cell death abnormality protein 1-like [Crassostrea angulata]